MIVKTLDSAQRDLWLRSISTSEFVHQHIGWQSTPHWLGKPASLILASPEGAMRASILVSPDGLGVAWLHLFAAGTPPGALIAWNWLWPRAREILESLPVEMVWVMTTQRWLIQILEQSGFGYFSNVLAMERQTLNAYPAPQGIRYVEPMQAADLAFVEELDHASFSPPWRMDSEALRITFERSALATVYRQNTGISGYQIAALTPQGIHLSRLAVDPAHRRTGIARALTAHLLDHFRRFGAPKITVNTQEDNLASLNLYTSMGFQISGEVYPVFRLSLKPS